MAGVRSLLLLLASCSLSATAGPAGTQAPSATHPEDARRPTTAGGMREAYLARFRSDYVGAVLAGTPAGILGYYADDIRLMPEFQKTVMGKGDVAAYHRAFAGRFAVGGYGRRETEVLDLGARVVEHGLFTMRVTVRGTSEAHELTGKYQDVWTRRPDGQLSLITQAWNYAHPTAIEPQLRFAAVPGVDVALRAHVPVNSPISFELAALNRLAEVTIAQHDARVWSQFYADDAVLMYSRQPAFAGRRAIDGFLAAHVKELPVFEALDIRTDRIDDLGRYVIEYASHIAAFRVGDQSGVNTGKNTVIWRREPGGALKMFRSMAMYD
jgi:ketosteroid isomerase-like protein